MAESTVSRRDFLKVSGGAGVGMVLSFYLPATTRWIEGTSLVEGQLNAWIKVGTDDMITFFVSESEMGQGIMTSLPMILAEEMEADWSRVRAEHAPANAGLYGNQSTGGSTSIRTNFDKLRKAGAAAREMLISAARETWGVAREDLRAENSAVIHVPSGRKLSFGELAVRASRLVPPEDPPLKDRKDFKLIGKRTKRLDTPYKVNGTAVYGMDVKVPGMLVAQVEHSPVFGGRLQSFDAAEALKVDGVTNVVEIPSGVAVVAKGYWPAKKGRDALRVTWDRGEYGDVSTTDITRMCRELIPKGADARNDGDADDVVRAAERKLTATYEVPYLAHATMEPMNCTAHVRSDGCDIWAPTQAPTATQSTAARITGLPPSRINVHTTFLGGGFGRRSAVDFVEDAVYTSKAVGAPVKVIYSREDDTRAGHYRPTAYNEFEGALDKDGWPLAWVHRIVSPSILDGKGWLRGRPIDQAAVEGAANIPYDIPNVHVTWTYPKLPITTHWWRSVGSSQNAFVTECFFDELAHAGGKDPVEARLRLLGKEPRHARVLEVAAEKAGWGKALPDGHYHGCAVHKSFGTIVAEVAEVSVNDAGEVHVHRVTVAVDCGDVVNPDTIEAQMHSAVAYGLTAALWGEITFKDGRVEQGNFDSYPVLRMNRMPRVDVHIVTSGDPLGGIGEPGTPPIAPAVCNAIFAATGKRVRKLPIRKV